MVTSGSVVKEVCLVDEHSLDALEQVSFRLAVSSVQRSARQHRVKGLGRGDQQEWQLRPQPVIGGLTAARNADLFDSARQARIQVVDQRPRRRDGQHPDLILVTHGKLAEEFVAAMQHVVGRQEAVKTVCIGPNDDMEARRSEIATAIGEVDSGEGVIVLTDLFGGTPSNLAISLMQKGKVEVIAGINLPMLIRLAKARGCMGLDKAVVAARDAGRNYITIASEFLGQDA